MATASTPKNTTGGRPKKQDSERRSNAIQVRLVPDSYAYVKTLAKARNSSMADVMRELANGEVTVISPEQEALLRQMATMANNLNQLARKAHLDGFGSVALLVERRVQELSDLLNQYRK